MKISRPFHGRSPCCVLLCGHADNDHEKILGAGAGLAAVLLTAGCLSSSDDDPVPVTPAPDGRPLALTILHINDHHSHLDATSSTLQLKVADGSRKAVSVSAGGFPRVKSAIDELAAKSPHVLKLHAGDALTGTLYFNRAGAVGEPDAAMMNTVCFDAFALGNHEFDKGDSGLKGFIDQLHAGSCKTPVLSANVSFAAASALHPRGRRAPCRRRRSSNATARRSASSA